jgi:histidinol-phosphatase
MAHSELLACAVDAALAGQEVIRHYYERNVEIQIKADRTPVTVADVETERAIKEVLRSAFPDHGFYGEEEGRENADADYLWLIDPIDGTKSFVREYPFFSTQIGLMHKGELILGVSNAPVFGELACAEKGQGAWLNDRPINVSEPRELIDATLSLGNVQTLAANPDRWAAFGELLRGAHRHRGYGDFYHYHLLACGKIDLIVESDVNILDISALSVIVQEAGGVFTDLDGNPLTLDTTSVCAASCSALHQLALTKLAG